MRVGIGQRIGHFGGERGGDLHRQSPLTLQPLAQGLPFDKRHDEVRHRHAGRVGDGTGIEDGQNVGVLEPGCELDFAEKALQPLGPAELGANHLHRHRALVPKVPGQIDRRHAAGTNLALEQVSAGQGVGQMRRDVAHSTGQSKAFCCQPGAPDLSLTPSPLSASKPASSFFSYHRVSIQPCQDAELPQKGDIMPMDSWGQGQDEPLLPEDRQRVIAEEEFRRLTADRMDKKLTSRTQRFLRIVNTPAAIWFLSSVVVAGAAWAYKEFQAHHLSRVEQEETLGLNTAELYYRLSACDRVDSAPNREDIENLLSAVIGLRPLEKEYQGVPLAAVYVKSCLLEGPCSVSPDSVLEATSTLRRLLWPEIVGRPIDRPFTNRAIVGELKLQCSRLSPLRKEIRSLLTVGRS